MEYTQNLAVENFASRLTFPLRASFGQPSRIGRFRLEVCLANEFPLSEIRYDAEGFPLAVTRRDAHEFTAEYAAENVVFARDFSLDYRLGAPQTLLSLIAYRAPEEISVYEIRNPALADRRADGFFELRALFNQQTSERPRPPRRLLLLVDTSLSMFGEKIRRAVEAADLVLHDLGPADEFNVVTFGGAERVFAPRPVAATPENVERAFEFVRAADLGGGTNLRATFARALELTAQFSAGERSLVLLSDVAATRETVDARRIAAVFEDLAQPVRLLALALGSDADTALLQQIAGRTEGFYLAARETEDVTPLVPLLLARIGRRALENPRFAADRSANFYGVYATGRYGFDGSSFSFIGRYKQPGPALLRFQAGGGADAVDLSLAGELPELAVVHDHLPRLWAKARIDALVAEMNLDGEREDFIEEIVALSQKYKVVSPYTAFLAAPRALLRPRLIQPGDPVIRVKTDESIAAVFAVLPFGETVPLHYLPAEKVWETRFLAPVWMEDGTYRCRLLLTDRRGFGYEETKTFVVDSRAPEIRIELPKRQYRAGDEIELRAASDRDTAKLWAKFYGARPAPLFWSESEKTNVGKILIPPGLASGRYALTVTAEDFARNQSAEELTVEILGN